MKLKKENVLLYAVTDRQWIGRQTLMQQVEAALQGGATMIQLREKSLDNENFLKEAVMMKALCQKYHVPLIINDNIQVAVKSDADGVHVGQNDMCADDVRKILGADKIIGVTAKTVAQALAAEVAGADYLGVGAVFATSTKTDTRQISHEVFSQICHTVSIPVVAIGGIHKHNIVQLSGLGADGVALVSAIFAAENIRQECIVLKKLVQAIL